MSMDLAERSDFVGANVRPEVKEAVREEARRENKSISRMLSDWIEEKLTEMGVSLERKPDVNERPLPFSEETK